jgi:hypothetical protein
MVGGGWGEGGGMRGVGVVGGWVKGHLRHGLDEPRQVNPAGGSRGAVGATPLWAVWATERSWQSDGRPHLHGVMKGSKEGSGPTDGEDEGF